MTLTHTELPNDDLNIALVIHTSALFYYLQTVTQKREQESTLLLNYYRSYISPKLAHLISNLHMLHYSVNYSSFRIAPCRIIACSRYLHNFFVTTGYKIIFCFKFTKVHSFKKSKLSNFHLFSVYFSQGARTCLY